MCLVRYGGDGYAIKPDYDLVLKKADDILRYGKKLSMEENKLEALVFPRPHRNWTKIG